MFGDEACFEGLPELSRMGEDVPIIIIEDGHVRDGNDAAWELVADLRVGEEARALFAESCRAKADDFLSSSSPGATELVIDRGETPVTLRFVLVSTGAQKLLIGRPVETSDSSNVSLPASTNDDLKSLERELSQRLLELDETRAQLAQARARELALRSELETLERLRSEWAAIIAHDLRQPVGTISLAAGMLMGSSPRPSRDRQCLERIRGASQRLHRMITDLSEVSQIEAKRLSVDPRWLDLGAIVRSCIDCVDPTSRPLRLATQGDTFGWADPDRIHQITDNLLSNALKYGYPDSEVVVEVIARDGFVEVIVSNLGDGIPDDQMPLLFGRFSRMREAREGRVSGLGLGLYIAKGLVEAHGGQLWAESVPGATTRFHFTVPSRFSP